MYIPIIYELKKINKLERRLDHISKSTDFNLNEGHKLIKRIEVLEHDIIKLLFQNNYPAKYKIGDKIGKYTITNNIPECIKRETDGAFYWRYLVITLDNTIIYIEEEVLDEINKNEIS